MFLLVPAYPGCPGSKAVKRLLLSLFSFFECIEVCAFISRKLNKLRFTFPNNFSPGILITKSIPPEGQGSGLQCPKIGLRTQNFKIFTFSHAPCDQMVRPRGSVTALFCSYPYNIAYRAPGGPTLKNNHPIPQNSWVGASFLFFLYGDPRDPSWKKFW